MINTAHLLGRVGLVDTKTLPGGTVVTNITIATNKKITKNGEKVDKVTWHNVSLFNKLSELASQYVQVGDLLYVQGEMESQEYQDKQGNKKVRNFIYGHEIKFMPRGDKSVAKKAMSPEQGSFADDPCPF